MKILMERYHNFCEYYQYHILSEHYFYIVKDGFEPIGRPKCKNTTYIDGNKVPWKKIDLGIAVTQKRVEHLKEHNIPFVFHIDQMPQENDDIKGIRALIDKEPTLYWSEEEANAWKVGTAIIRPHPIDTDIFKGYNPIKKKAITIASRSFASWGLVKGNDILNFAYNILPIQVIAQKDNQYPNSYGIFSEKEMIKTLQKHQIYFNCAWKLDRSPLEAMAVGMPVIAIRTSKNVYKKYFNEEKRNIIYASTKEEMVEKTKMLLENLDKCKEIGQKARDIIKKFWNPKISNEKWNEAFELAL